MWICKECGEEITVLAAIPTQYEVFLNKNKKVFDYGDCRIKDITKAKIKKAFCEHCGQEGNLKDIAKWIENDD